MMSPEFIATHEAGHGVAMIQLGGRMTGLSIDPPAQRGNAYLDGLSLTRGEHRAAVLFAGMSAVQALLPKANWMDGADSDYSRIERAALDGVNVELAELIADEIILANVRPVRALTSALLKERKLTERDIAAVLKTAPLSELPWEFYHATALRILERAESRTR